MNTSLISDVIQFEIVTIYFGVQRNDQQRLMVSWVERVHWLTEWRSFDRGLMQTGKTDISLF